jgi:hypothetical protein
MSDESKKERAALLFQVRRVLVTRTEAATADRVRLRDAVCAFVFAEQRKGISLASMVHTITELLERAEKSTASDSREKAAPNASRDLARQLVEWCVEFFTSGTPMIPPGPALLS